MRGLESTNRNIKYEVAPITERKNKGHRGHKLLLQWNLSLLHHPKDVSSFHHPKGVSSFHHPKGVSSFHHLYYMSRCLIGITLSYS